MKRLNTVFFAGLLCFSLGYIALDIVGEAGVKLSGPAQASPISPITAPTLYDSNVDMPQQRALLISHDDKNCRKLQDVLRDLVSALREIDDRRASGQDIYLDPAKWQRIHLSLIMIQRDLCHIK